MRNILTCETAFKLKDAGFPQPKPDAGQVWYLNVSRPRPVTIGYMEGKGMQLEVNGIRINETFAGWAIFAPNGLGLCEGRAK